MKVIRFNVQMEDYPEVIRVIDLQSSQTFEDLHFAILESVGFDSSQLASFYLCDDAWVRKMEITLIDMSPEETDMIPVMSSVPLGDYIVSKGQKIIYEYDFVLMWRFLVQVEDIMESKSKKKYPILISSEGDAPKQYETAERYPEEITEEDSQYIREFKLGGAEMYQLDQENDERWDEDDEMDDFGSDGYVDPYEDREEDYY